METKQPNSPKARKMRICNKLFSRVGGVYVAFPDIRLCGKWLQDSGFKAGQYIEITHDAEKIVITRQSDNSQ